MPKFTKQFVWGEGATLPPAEAGELGSLPQMQSLIYREWVSQRRPFLHVWPSMVEALSRTDIMLDPGLIPRSIVHELGALEIRCDDASGDLPFMLGLMGNDRDDKDGVLCTMVAVPDTDGDMVQFFASALPFGGVTDAPAIRTCSPSLDKAVRLALGVLLLATDPDYLTPILLNRDAVKEPVGDALAAAIARARRNGRYGFEIGANMEVSPHFRRPHFGLRWTGAGRTVPRLVPIKGCIVKKSIMSHVPTGYHDDSAESRDATNPV